MFSGALLILLLSALVGRVASAASAVIMKFSGHGFGPDGPWQGVDLSYIPFVGGSRTVYLYPSISMETIVQHSNSCFPYDNTSTTCGMGGFWVPWDNITLDADLPNKKDARSTGDVDVEGAYVIHRSAEVYDRGHIYPVDNFTVLLARKADRKLANGKTIGMSLGTLSLGGADSNRFGLYEDSRKFNDSQSLLSGLFKQGAIPAFTYALQIGSAALNYTGSLVFGGYDKGRILGSYTTWTDSLKLLDIEFNVMAGHLPLGIPQRQSILLESERIKQISLSSDTPYIKLPSRICDRLADSLPTYFDPVLKYWLWNTSDPRYPALLRSPAYFGFIFPPAAGNTKNVTIKVPLRLLDLTLTQPISSKNVSYFPCVQDNWASLGRAFLQAASTGQNHLTGLSWLAQAPGPGLTREGLGSQVVSFANESAILDTFPDSDDQLLIHSWKPFWDNIEDVNATSKSRGLSASSTKGLSSQAKGGIGVGIGIAILALFAFAILYVKARRRRNETSQLALQNEMEEKAELPGRELPQELPEYQVNSELMGDEQHPELPGHENAAELPANEPISTADRKT